MAVRDDFAPGEVLAAADLNDTFASKLPYSFGTATPSTTDSGFLWYDSNSTPAAPKFWDGAAFQALTSGKILQVVRATDATNRSTTSTTYVDATLDVSISPQKSDSAVLLIATGYLSISGSANVGRLRITDSSNNAISGATEMVWGQNTATTERHGYVVIAYATPATTSAVTYKLQFRTNSGSTMTLNNTDGPGQMFAIEVAA